MRSAALVTVIALAVLAGCGDGADPGGGRFDAAAAFRDLRAQVRLGPRPSGSPAARQEVALIVHRLRRAGVRGIAVQRPRRNVVARIPGSRPGVVVAGAHYDTKDLPGFVGANDGASGVAVLLGLARALPERIHGASIELVFFDAEEARGTRDFEQDGTRGSRQFVRYARAGGRLGSPPIQQIRAMALFDMVGDCDLAIPREPSSDPGLYEEFARAAAARTGSEAPFEGTAGGIEDDHTAFVQAGVPAVDLIDFAYGPGGTPGAWWHTPDDTLERVCPASLDAVGEAALVALPRIAGRGS